MSVFLKSVRRDALMEPDSALGKLLKNGASESAAGNNENAALFFTQAAGMLMAHGVRMEMKMASKYYALAAEEYKKAAAKSLTSGVDGAVLGDLYSKAGRAYRLSGDGRINECIECYRLSAAYYHAEADLLFTSEFGKERAEMMSLRSANSNWKVIDALLATGYGSGERKLELAEIYERISDAYGDIITREHISRSARAISEAVFVLKLTFGDSRLDLSAAFRILKKAERRHMRNHDVIGAACSVLEQSSLIKAADGYRAR